MHTIDNQKFGKLLMELRVEKGMTQKQLAEQLFVSDKAVSKWERGLSFPDISLLLPLSEILSVSITELLLGTRFVENTNISLMDSDQLIEKVILLRGRQFRLKDLLKQKESMKKSIRVISIFTTISITLNLLAIVMFFILSCQKITWLEIEKVGLVAMASVHLLFLYNLVSLLFFLYLSIKKSICYLFASLTYLISGLFLLYFQNFMHHLSEIDAALIILQNSLMSYLMVCTMNVAMIFYGVYRYKKYREKI